MSSSRYAAPSARSVPPNRRCSCAPVHRCLTRFSLLALNITQRRLLSSIESTNTAEYSFLLPNSLTSQLCLLLTNTLIFCV